MNVVPIKRLEPLEALASIINEEHAQLWRAGRTALEHAVRCGEALLEAQAVVPRGRWLVWLRDNVTVHPTSAYKYMRLARHREKVLAPGIEGVQAGLDAIAQEPWHDRSRLSGEDKAEMRRLVETHSLEEVAESFGCAVSTVWRWTSEKSPVSRSAPRRGLAAARLPEGTVDITDEMCAIAHDVLREREWNSLHSWADSGSETREAVRLALDAALNELSARASI